MHGASPDFGEQGLFAYSGISVMDERNLILQDVLFHEILFRVIVYTKANVFPAIAFCAKIAIISNIKPYYKEVNHAQTERKQE